MARRKIVAGNWKMNKTPSEAVALVNELKPLVANDEVSPVRIQGDIVYLLLIFSYILPYKNHLQTVNLLSL